MECGTWNEEDWEILLYTLKQGNCILMLGPDASAETADGRWRPLTEQLAQEVFDMLDPEIQQNIDKSNLTQVLQYYYIKKKKSALHAKVHLFYEAKQQIENELYTYLAALPFHLIMTSTPDTLFYEALKNAQKAPEIDRYNFRGENRNMVYEGTVQSPLVFHLYGILNEPESLVLTEIDLIDFLAAVIAKNPSLPRNILSQLRGPNKSLLFLGFGFKHWYLRILLHVLQGRSKESNSFALEQCVPQNMKEFQQTILFFSKSRYNIQICEQELLGFARELRERYEKSGSAQSAPTLIRSGPVIFICHVTENTEQAANMYTHLETAGFRAWRVTEGQHVSDDEIERAIVREIDYVIVLQSDAMLQQCVDSFDESRIPHRKSEKTKMTNLGQKLKLIQHNLDVGGYTIVAKECMGLVEQSLRRLFRDQLTRLDEKDRLKVQEAELKKGGGRRGIEHFTMGQLVRLLQSSNFLDAYERALGKDLSGLRVVNLEELTRLRNRLIHDNREVTRAEAEFLVNCLQVILETFEIELEDTVSPKMENEIGLPQQYSCKEVIRFALERQKYVKPGTSFIIPVKIEDCPVLQELRDIPIQTINVSNEENIKIVISTIRRDQQLRKKR